MNKLVPCAWLLSGAPEILRLRLRLLLLQNVRTWSVLKYCLEVISLLSPAIFHSRLKTELFKISPYPDFTPAHQTFIMTIDCNRTTTLSPRFDLSGFWPAIETKWESWLLRNWFSTATVNKLASLHNVAFMDAEKFSKTDITLLTWCPPVNYNCLFYQMLWTIILELSSCFPVAVLGFGGLHVSYPPLFGG